ncbi:MAG TPA: hypothetical protein VF712_16415 [Thermoleophilaceae bacterium]|jgi:hypothetical protein
MSERLSDIGGKLLAGAVLLIAGWILLKFVLGFLAWVATVVMVLIAVVAVLWALNRLF